MSFFRYPGGKTKLKKQIVFRLKQLMDVSGTRYIEPFFGGGSVGLTLLKNDPNIKKIWINDKDIGIASLWTALIRYPEDFKDAIRNFKPSVESFNNIKKELIELNVMPKQRNKIVDIGAKKLQIHQISYSGLGTKSGGPLGGEKQKSEYKIDCRWSPDYLRKKIRSIHTLLKDRAKCTCKDFEEVVLDTTENALIYLDPPYYVEGNKLYQCGFTNDDHQRLMKTLQKSKMPWILSYDDDKNGEVRKLYNWASFERITVKYSITALRVEKDGETTCQSREKPELLISPKIKL